MSDDVSESQPQAAIPDAAIPDAAIGPASDSAAPSEAAGGVDGPAGEGQDSADGEGSAAEEEPKSDAEVGADGAGEEHPDAVAAPVRPAPRDDRWAHRRAEPRPLALLWTLYLFVCTAVTFARVEGAGLTTPDIYRPAARVLMVLTAFGAVILWPMIRLSQRSPVKSVRRAVFADACAVFFPAQAVIWPQWLPPLGDWHWTVAAGVAAVIGGWIFLTGGLLSAAMLRVDALEQRGVSTTSVRINWMVLLLVAPVSGPAAWFAWTAWAASASAGMEPVRWLLLLSPFTAVYEMTQDRFWTGQAAIVLPMEWRSAGLTWIAALAVWIWSGIRGATVAKSARRA